MLEYGLTEYNKIKACGICILIKKTEEPDIRKSGGIYLPKQKKWENAKIGAGQIVDISKKAKEKTSLLIGDYVLYDYYSAHDDNGKYILTNYENILVKLNKDEYDEFLNGAFRG